MLDDLIPSIRDMFEQAGFPCQQDGTDLDSRWTGRHFNLNTIFYGDPFLAKQPYNNVRALHEFAHWFLAVYWGDGDVSLPDFGLGDVSRDHIHFGRKNPRYRLMIKNGRFITLQERSRIEHRACALTWQLAHHHVKDRDMVIYCLHDFGLLRDKWKTDMMIPLVELQQHGLDIDQAPDPQQWYKDNKGSNGNNED
jgi:hypothetical protein